MLSETLTAATPQDLLSLPLFTLVLFVVVFGGVCWHVWRRGSDDPTHSYAAGLPLQSDDVARDTLHGGTHDG